MFSGSRERFLYPVILSVVIAAAAVLAYYAWKTASQFARLGEETIAQTTLLLVNEKVDQVEQELIAADNEALTVLRRNAGEAISNPAVYSGLSPTLRSAIAVDDSGKVEGLYFKGSAGQRRRFIKLFLEKMLFDMELERQRMGRLRHLHRSYGNTSYLLSYKATRKAGRRRYLVLVHDTDVIVEEHFSNLFAKEQGKQLFNVVDNQGRRVFGKDLAGAGDYLVGRRFPTTLYEWRLQIAPKQAPRLKEEGRNRQINEVALIAIAFIIILMGIAFFVYAAGKERRLNSLKAEFIANVSHELKTPLSVVRMFAELLSTNRVPDVEKQRRYLEIICRESDRLTGLIDNVLDFSALERGKQSYDFQVAAIEQVVSRAIDTFRYRVEESNVVIQFDPPKAPVRARVDEHAVLLALINLLDNAVKYGAAPVRIQLTNEAEHLTVAVQDSGAGIPAEALRRIFERFFRAQKNRSVRGSGIGLALVKEIAEAHGGKAFARNLPSGGAEVGFRLPLPDNENQPSPLPG